METSRSEHGGVLIGGAPSPEETAAIIAALEQFRRDTAPPAVPVAERSLTSAWKRAALAEGVARAPELTL